MTATAPISRGILAVTSQAVSLCNGRGGSCVTIGDHSAQLPESRPPCPSGLAPTQLEVMVACRWMG